MEFSLDIFTFYLGFSLDLFFWSNFKKHGPHQ